MKPQKLLPAMKKYLNEHILRKLYGPNASMEHAQ